MLTFFLSTGGLFIHYYIEHSQYIERRERRGRERREREKKRKKRRTEKEREYEYDAPNLIILILRGRISRLRKIVGPNLWFLTTRGNYPSPGDILIGQFASNGCILIGGGQRCY